MSPFLSSSLNSFLVHVIFSYLINPFDLFSISISTLNFSILLTIARFQFIDFSNFNFFNPLVQFSEFFCLSMLLASLFFDHN